MCGSAVYRIRFVDIMPTLADLASISVPPLCPEDSSKVLLCTEGVSLRPIFADPTHEVKRASFSQYPHRGWDGGGLSSNNQQQGDEEVVIGDESVVDFASYEQQASQSYQQRERHEQQEQQQLAAACPTNTGVLGDWYSSAGSLFIFKNDKGGGVTLDSSHCKDCSFISAVGRQTTGASYAGLF